MRGVNDSRSAFTDTPGSSNISPVESGEKETARILWGFMGDRGLTRARGFTGGTLFPPC